MKTLNSFIIKISFAAQTGEKICLSREHWLMVFRQKSPRKGTENLFRSNTLLFSLFIQIEESPEGDGKILFASSSDIFFIQIEESPEGDGNELTNEAKEQGMNIQIEESPEGDGNHRVKYVSLQCATDLDRRVPGRGRKQSSHSVSSSLSVVIQIEESPEGDGNLFTS